MNGSSVADLGRGENDVMRTLKGLRTAAHHERTRM